MLSDNWTAAGAQIAEYEKLTDEHMDLESAFKFLCEETDTMPSEERRTAFFAGHRAYQMGMMVRISGEPFIPSEQNDRD